MLWRVIGLIVVPVLLSACQGPDDRLWLRAPGWSRGFLVGTTQVGDPVPLANDEQGTLYFFLVERAGEVSHPHIVALDPQVQTLWETTLDIDLVRPDKPRLLWAGGRLQLFWLSDHRLYQVALDADGNLLGVPALLSGEIVVDHYDVSHDGRGTIAVWYAGSRREPGLYALALGASDRAALLIDPEGIRPAVQYDAAGTLHAVWYRRPVGYGSARFFYAAHPQGDIRAGEPSLVLDQSLSPSFNVFGPKLGLSQQDLYMFWTVRIGAGLQAGTTETGFVRFPPGNPSGASGLRLIRIPTAYNLSYEPLQAGDFLGGPRVSLRSPGLPTTPALEGLSTLPGQAGELPIAFQVKVDYLYRKQEGQIGVAFVEDGAPTGYQLLSFTPTASTAPSLLSDPAKHLYIAWLEKSDSPGFLVYFASTAPEIQDELRALTGGDIGRLVGEVSFGMLTGALLAPLLAIIWLFLPMIVLGLTVWIRRDTQTRVDPGTLVSLGLAVAAFWMVKTVTLPGIRTYIPFSAWMPMIPDWLNPILLWGVPGVILLTALWIAWRFTYQRANRSVVYFFLLYAGVDGLLTMAVYGVLIYAAF